MAMDEAPPERPPIATAPLSAILYVPPAVTGSAGVLASWSQPLAARDVEFELVLVVSARRQDAVREALELKNRDGRLHIVQHLGPEGVGPEIQTGLWMARFPLILVTPCDGQFRPGD